VCSPENPLHCLCSRSPLLVAMFVHQQHRSKPLARNLDRVQTTSAWPQQFSFWSSTATSVPEKRIVSRILLSCRPVVLTPGGQRMRSKHALRGRTGLSTSLPPMMMKLFIGVRGQIPGSQKSKPNPFCADRLNNNPTEIGSNSQKN